MANFTRIKALGWALDEELTSAQLNLLDTHHTKAINGDEGSSHSPTSPIVIGGTQGLTLGVSGTPLPFGGFINGALVWRGGSAPISEVGLTLDGVGDNASLLWFINSADALWASGCTATFQAGATLTISGALNMAGTETQTGQRTISGSLATNAVRISNTTAADGTYGGEEDIWNVPSQLGGVVRVYTLRSTVSLPNPPASQGMILEFVRNAVALDAVGSVEFRSEGGALLATMDANTRTNIRFLCRAAPLWEVLSKTTWT